MANSLMVAPSHNWIADPRSIALINSIEARHPVQESVTVASYTALFQRVDDARYSDGRVEALGLIREEYADRCLAVVDDTTASRKPFADYCLLPNETTLTAIICGHWYYDPTSQWTAFEAAWLEGRKVAA